MKHNLNLKDFKIDEIVDIELIGEEDTIDISVEGTQMFFANDIYTHNSSVSSEVVTADQTGGSITKMQIGHVILTVGKTLEQKRDNFATMTIFKSRIGPDGIVFQNCEFNNEYMSINVNDESTILGIKEDREKKKMSRPHELYKEKMKEQQQLHFEDNNVEKEQPVIEPIKELTLEEKRQRLREMSKKAIEIPT